MGRFKHSKCLAVEHEELIAKYKLMQHEWKCQQETISRLGIQVSKLQSQVRSQAQFTSEMGSTFGYCLWRSSQIPDVSNMLIRQRDKLVALSHTAISVLTSFDKTYHTNTPIAETDETKFVLSIIGIVANLTTAEEGRQFFSTTNCGRTVVHLIVSIVIRLPNLTGAQLKKVSYVALYNVSIFSIVSPMIIVPELIGVLNDDIKMLDTCANQTAELRWFALKLIQSLIRNVCNRRTYGILKDNIDESRLVKLTLSDDAEVNNIARNILNDLKLAKAQYESTINRK